MIKKMDRREWELLFTLGGSFYLEALIRITSLSLEDIQEGLDVLLESGFIEKHHASTGGFTYRLVEKSEEDKILEVLEEGEHTAGWMARYLGFSRRRTGQWLEKLETEGKIVRLGEKYRIGRVK